MLNDLPLIHSPPITKHGSEIPLSAQGKDTCIASLLDHAEISTAQWGSVQQLLLSCLTVRGG